MEHCRDLNPINEKTDSDIFCNTFNKIQYTVKRISDRLRFLLTPRIIGYNHSEKLYAHTRLCYVSIYNISCLISFLFFNVFTLQKHQRIRTFAIYQTFLTLKFVLWAMEIFTFSSIQPISVKIWGKYIYRKI